MNPFEALRLINLRLRGLAINDPKNPEVARLSAARDEVFSRMTKEDLQEWENRDNAEPTQAELARERAAINKQIEENKDRPSI